MKKFVIENGILKAYLGLDSIVVVPKGVTNVGGDLLPEDKECPRSLRGDMFGYKAFYNNHYVEELYLPDSVVEIGFKALEHCKRLQTL